MANDPTIKFKADTKQLKTAKNDLDNVKNSAFGVGQAANDAKGGIKKFGGSLKEAAKSSMALKAGLVAVTATTVKMLSTFSTAERGQMRLDALFKSTGGTAGFTADQIGKLSEEIGRNTLQSAEGMRDAAGALMSFRAIGGQAFEDTLRLSADLSEVMGTDARSSALQLGKALEDPKNGLTMLRRAGISFTDQQKEMIFGLQESGDLMGAQAAIIKTLQGQLGGAGEGAGKGLAGAVDLVGENFALFSTNLMEATGIASLSTKVMTGLGNAFGFLAKKAGAPSVAEDQESLANLQRRRGFFKEGGQKQQNIDAQIAEIDARIANQLEADFHAEQMAIQHQEELKRIATEAQDERDLLEADKGELEVFKDFEKKQKLLEQELQFRADHGDIVAKAKLAEERLDNLTGKKRLLAQKREGMNMLAFLGQNSRKAFELHKALALGSAVVQTAQGVTNALKKQDYSGAARVAAMGAMEISTIKSTDFGGGGSGGGFSGGGTSAGDVSDASIAQAELPQIEAQASQVVNVSIDGSIDPSGARRIIEAINEATEDGLEINALVGT